MYCITKIHVAHWYRILILKICLIFCSTNYTTVFQGCNVIGFAGSDDKVKFIKEELGFDHAFNYKTDDIDKSIRQAAPNGIDCYFDNVRIVCRVLILCHTIKPIIYPLKLICELRKLIRASQKKIFCVVRKKRICVL